MPKVETFLKSEVISAVQGMAEESQISRSNWIRDAVLEKLEREGYDIKSLIHQGSSKDKE